MQRAIGCTSALFVLLGTTLGVAQSAAKSGDPTAEASIQRMENELSQAVKAHDTAPFLKYLDEDASGFGPGWKSASRAEIVEGIKSNPCTVNSFSNTGFAYKWISPDVVLVTYTTKSDHTCQGKSASSTEYQTSLWHRKAGTWVSTFHQATAVEAGASS